MLLFTNLPWAPLDLSTPLSPGRCFLSLQNIRHKLELKAENAINIRHIVTFGVAFKQLYLISFMKSINHFIS